MVEPRREPDPQEALARTRSLLQRAAAATAAIVAFLASVTALNLDGLTKTVRLPLWAVILVVAFLSGVTAWYVLYMYFENRRVSEGITYWRGESRTLEGVVSRLEDLAYYDTITGLPNAASLDRQMSDGHHADRCLILLDLKDFGRVNKMFGHWKGDEYLRHFATMISDDSRRNEYVYKPRKPLVWVEDDGVTKVVPPRRAHTTDSAVAAIEAFRRHGGDEFYVLLHGGVIDGLGYLNRLHGRAKTFEDMADRVLNAPHPFGFRAGLIALGKDEQFSVASQRVEEALLRTTRTDSQSLVDWGRVQHDNRTPADFDDPRFKPGTMEGNILAAAKSNFTVESA